MTWFLTKIAELWQLWQHVWPKKWHFASYIEALGNLQMGPPRNGPCPTILGPPPVGPSSLKCKINHVFVIFLSFLVPEGERDLQLLCCPPYYPIHIHIRYIQRKGLGVGGLWVSGVEGCFGRVECVTLWSEHVTLWRCHCPASAATWLPSAGHLDTAATSRLNEPFIGPHHHRHHPGQPDQVHAKYTSLEVGTTF